MTSLGIRKKEYLKRYLFIGIIGIILLTACQGVSPQLLSDAPFGSPASPESTQMPLLEKTLDDKETAITVVDALGRQVTLPEAPQRIVVTGRAVIMVLDAVYMFPEAYDRVVAFDNASQSDRNFIKLIDPGFDEKASLVQDAGVEQVVVARPDLVIMKSSQAEKLGEPLEVLGIPVVYVDFETPEQYIRDIMILGEIFQNKARASELVAFYQSRMDGIASSVSNVEVKPRVLMLYYTDRDGVVAFNVPPASWIQTRIVEMAGGDPVWVSPGLSQGWNKVSFEQIVAWDAEEIFIISYTKDTSEVVSLLKADSLWQALNAVKQDRLYAFPADIYSWDQPDARWILGLSWLSATLHPEQFADLDITQEARTFYEQLFGLDETFFVEHIQPTFSGDLP